MSCSQCYTAQVSECIGELKIFVSEINVPSDLIVIKITDSHGNVFYLDASYLDEIITIDIANSNLPKNLFNRYAGTMTIEVLHYLGGVATMVICEKEYTCINVAMINNNLQEYEYYIGCPPQ